VDLVNTALQLDDPRGQLVELVKHGRQVVVVGRRGLRGPVAATALDAERPQAESLDGERRRRRHRHHQNQSQHERCRRRHRYCVCMNQTVNGNGK